MSRCLLTLGTFDGIHRGHQKLMRWMIARARRLHLRTKVLLFDVPPRFYFHPEMAAALLTTSAERCRMLKELGVDTVSVLRFGARWANMAHTRFFTEYLVRRWKAAGILAGQDFAFGKGRKGDLRYLKTACAEFGITVDVLPLLRVSGKKISSSHIRELLERGDVHRAALWLGRPHSVSGRVVRGKGLGKGLGFPTANVAFPQQILVPRGVYQVQVSGAGLIGRKAVCNVGTRPTIGGSHKVVLEVHIRGFSGSLYGKILKVEFLKRIRAERRFHSLDALKRQIRKDVRTLL